MGSRLWKLIGWLIVLGLVVLACGFEPNRYPSTTRTPDPMLQLGLVCMGAPISAAAPYAGSGLHPAVLEDEHSEWPSESWSDQIPEAWSPARSEEAQLVVCVGEIEDISLEVCPYNLGSDITRYRRDLPVRILEARTGNLVAQKTFVGSDPRHCQATENMNTTVLYGEIASYSEVETWFRQYVESGAAATQPAAKDVNVYCGYFGDSPQVLEADQMVSLYWQWTATTDEYRQDYIDAITFFLRLDGEPIDISTADRSLDSCEAENWPCVTWRLEPIALQPGTHEVVMTQVFNREIQDGFDMDADGNLDTYGGEWVREPACEIIVQ